MKMPHSRREESLKKLNLIELEEVLQRENALLKNKRVVDNLSDKGESIRKFRESVEKEIHTRKQLAQLQAAMSKLTSTDTDKHVQKLYDIETIPEKERYKPFSTLNTVKEVPPDSKIFTVMEDCSPCSKSAKLIPLPESLNLLQTQESRAREEQMKARQSRALEKLKQEMEKDEDSDSNSEYSEGDLEEEK